ncbi:hypothetical protein [Aliiroseovarius subalbicans]|uniref:hypothetical protein n=1 Tax=Aliiroseovarius subalbicans TaxID=2925840 RepID=UPI001F586A5E|nr:hypothetical protein [Aliiroseovarius subalbicans]MCI2398144.1 hypothetical protein [Aliiroseovarius subalbicans]
MNGFVAAFCFILGLGLALRPTALLRALLFKPAVLAMVLFLGLGAAALMRDLTVENATTIGIGMGVAVFGGLDGGALRRWGRGRDV